MVIRTTFIRRASRRKPNEIWTVYPSPNIPTEREMTVLEAEQQLSDY